MKNHTSWWPPICTLPLFCLSTVDYRLFYPLKLGSPGNAPLCALQLQSTWASHLAQPQKISNNSPCNLRTLCQFMASCHYQCLHCNGFTNPAGSQMHLSPIVGIMASGIAQQNLSLHPIPLEPSPPNNRLRALSSHQKLHFYILNIAIKGLEAPQACAAVMANQGDALAGSRNWPHPPFHVPTTCHHESCVGQAVANLVDDRYFWPLQLPAREQQSFKQCELRGIQPDHLPRRWWCSLVLLHQHLIEPAQQGLGNSPPFWPPKV